MGPAPVAYAPNDADEVHFLKGTTNIFETLASDKTDEAPLTNVASLLSLTGLDCIFKVGASLLSHD